MHMRRDRHGPTTRFRRRRGRQGNRRQRLSSAVAGGTTRGREGRPLPHFPAEVGDRPTPTLAGVARGRPPLIHSPSPENPVAPVAVRRGVAHRGSTDWPCSPGQNTKPPPPSEQKPSYLALAWIPVILVKTIHSLSFSSPYTLSLLSELKPAPAIVRNPGILSSQSFTFPDNPTPPPSEADTLS